MTKFIHTADLHLGKSFTSMGDDGDALRAAQFETLERIADLAKSDVVDFLVIAGDIFDSNEVKRQSVRKVAEILGGIAPIPVIILPGTHDVLDKGSIYLRDELRSCDNVKIFGVGDQTEFKVGDTVVHGRANTTKQGGIHPLDELMPEIGARFNIAVLHASIEIEGKYSEDDYLVGMDTITACGMDYVALGHWHKMGEFSQGEVTAWYCGAPEVTKYDEAGSAGNVLVVEMGEGGVTVRPVPVSKYQWLVKEIDVSTCPPGPALELEIASLAGDNVILRVRLTGSLEKGEEVDVGSLEEQFADDFFHLEIEDSKVSYPASYAEGVFPDETIGAFFVGRMKTQIAAAGDESEKAVLEKALARGAHYIVEGEV